MRFGDPFADGEPQARPRSLTGAGACRIRAPETVEDVRQVAGGDADPRVGDAEGEFAVGGPELQAHAPARRRVLHGVGDEIEDQLAYPGRVDGHHDRLGRRRHFHPHAGLLREQLTRLARLLDDSAQVDGLAVQRRDPLVRARQREQRLHQLGHALDLLQGLLQRRKGVLRQVGRGDGALHAGAQHGQRCLELVTGVGGKASQGGEAPLQPGHHLVERFGEAAELVLHQRLRQPAVQAPTVRDLADFGDDLVHGAERASGDPRPHEQGHGHAKGQHERERREQLIGTELGRAHVRRGEDGPELGTRIGKRADGVVQRRPVGLDVEAARGPTGAGSGRDATQLLHLLERERPGIRRREQQAAVPRRDDQDVGDRLEQRGDVGDEHRAPGAVRPHQHPARPVAFRQDARGERGFRAHPLVQVLVGGAAPVQVQHRGERGEREREGRRVPGGEPTADRLHVRPSRRSPPRAPCESALARARGRSSCAAA